MRVNIPLDRTPRTEDFADVMAIANDPCECSGEMKENLEHGDEIICKPCAARQVLNGLTSLAEEIGDS